MLPSTDLFCVHCAKINFDFFTKPRQEDNQEKLPHIFWNTLLPEHCQFCQLLNHCIQNSGDKKSLQETLRGVYTGHELQLYIESKETSRRLDYSIRHCESIPSSNSNDGLRNSPHFDVTELRLWLRQCDTTHQCLPRDLSQQPLPEDFRLIDVNEYCIVQHKAHVKYCALSYVWGNRQQPLLTLSNKQDFESKSKKFLQKLDLPRTIVDAMALCREIGCRYLWVDSLCIIQDSNENKHIQISSMAEVYSQSFLAFIATAGHDSDAGLTPYGSRGRSSNISYLLRRNLKGSFVASLSPQIAAQEIAKSAWASRGWTLQEYALSRRVLFFTGSYAFLRCEKELRCEDFGLGFSTCFEEDRKWDLPLPSFYRRTPNPDRHYPSTFSRLLAQFVRRSLRFERDILDAFTGILTRMECGKDGDYGIGAHLWGLPSSEFGAALQWKTNAPWPSTERAGFPSWSWAGWIHENDSPPPDGSFHDMYEGSDNRATDISVLTWYKYHDDKSIHIVGECNFEQIFLGSNQGKQEISCIEMELQRHFTPQPCKELATFVEQSTISNPPLSHHIFLWASCASLYVDRLPKTAGHPETWNFPLCIKKGYPQIGSICLKPEWRENEPDFMHFFVSTAGVHFSPVTAGLAPDSSQLKFKVILTKLYCVAKLPVYKRIQVSHTAIYPTDWALAHPKSRLIALV